MYPAVMGTALLTLLQASAPALGKLDRLRSLFLQVPWPRKPVSKFYNLLWSACWVGLWFSGLWFLERGQLRRDSDGGMFWVLDMASWPCLGLGWYNAVDRDVWPCINIISIAYDKMYATSDSIFSTRTTTRFGAAHLFYHKSTTTRRKKEWIVPFD